jgi:hypothetical protein
VDSFAGVQQQMHFTTQNLPAITRTSSAVENRMAVERNHYFDLQSKTRCKGSLLQALTSFHVVCYV